jgi:hypothetical protein
VGLSTIPSRIGELEPTIRSLAEQTRRPDAVLLALPAYSLREKCEYVIPANIRALEEAGLMRIVRAPEDYGPGTKLLGCLPEIGNTDVFIAADDDMLYRPFFIEELAGAVERSGGAASFHVYESLGLKIGQGADGFAMAGRLAQVCAGIVPLLDAHPRLRRHDDYWISFILRREGIRIESLAERCAAHGERLAYKDRKLPGGLLSLEADGRVSLNRDCHSILFTHGRPTLSMRLEVPFGLLRGALRRTRRMLAASGL